ncbi:MAG: AmmeMemoRadiSam system protein B [Candidatus Omnitrophica bacterium]|nr:AmmeMemoRadiSam system protein B [Candidatus Omnitrophota bacterium]MCM8827932.1 AmmeMemoRadiSam system protein B [Candidatus Omnitrophota bacterium]
MKKIRKPSVSGYFYPGMKTNLIEDLKKYIVYEENKIIPKGIICPHAGYVYSGKTAGKVYGKIAQFETAIILGPNHHGYGEPYAIDDSDEWETPIGNVEIDTEIRKKLLEKSRYLQIDSMSHKSEHSIEVQVPFLQFLNPAVKIVPVLISSMYDANPWYEIGYSIALALSEIKRNAIVVASSDFTHYEPAEQAEKKDRMAIEKILKLDADEFLNIVSEHDISICGFAPITAAITASKILEARQGILVDYTNSGNVSGDFEQVVGYAGIMFI